jgi:hypothetical protein
MTFYKTRTARALRRGPRRNAIGLCVIGAICLAPTGPDRSTGTQADKSSWVSAWSMIAFTGIARAQEGPKSARGPINPVRSIDQVQLKGFLERPLFDPSRQLPPVLAPVPIRAVESVVAAPPQPPPVLHVTGIIEGKDTIAVVHRDNDSKTIMLSNGDRISDWSVMVLPSLGLQLRNGDRVVTYTLFGPPKALPGRISQGPPPELDRR